MKSNLTLFWIFAVSLVILSCNKNKNALETSDNAESIPADSLNYITVSKDQFAAAGMELGGIRTYEYAESVTASGYIDVPPDNRAKIGTFMGGYVKSANLLPGDHVRKGQILIILENIEYLKLQQSFLETKEQLEYLKSVYESQKTLADEKISSQTNYLQAKSDYNSMLAAYESISRQLQLLLIDPLTVKA
jgi:cobalt-zinc-cadmium efflux system membrane fusion protein